MGLGMFAPDIRENRTLYFYGNINPEKPWDEHHPYDSITFERDSNNNVVIASAPPWLNPQHLKLDFGYIFFKIKTVNREFAEVEVNTHNGQTAHVSHYAGKIMYWPDFLLNVHSLEFGDDRAQAVRGKPLDVATEVRRNYSIMQPVAIHFQLMMQALDRCCANSFIWSFPYSSHLRLHITLWVLM